MAEIPNIETMINKQKDFSEKIFELFKMAQ